MTDWFNIKILVSAVSGLKVSCLMLLLTCPLQVSAQNYPLREYTVLEGLPQTQARSLFQDSRGFLWVITRNGISRFDGIEFKNFFRKDGLPSNNVTQIFEDKNGYIIAHSSDGLSRFDGYNFEFFPYNEKLPSERFLHADAVNDTILLILYNNVTLHNKLICFINGIYSEYPKENHLLDTMDINFMTYDIPSGFLFLVDSFHNLWKWRNGNLIPVTDTKIRAMKRDRGKTVLEGYGKSYEISGGRIVRKNFINDDGRTEIMDEDTEAGDFLDVYKGGTVTKINHPYYSSSLIDNESNIWFGTEVNLYMLTSTAFSYLDDGDGLPKNTWAIAEDLKGQIWFGSLTGDLLVYDGKEFVPRNDYRKLFGSDPAFYKGSIRSSDGNVYFSLNQGVLIWNGNTFSRLSGIPDFTQVCIIYEDPDDRSLLFGTEYGLYHIKNGKTECCTDLTSNKFGITEGIVNDDSGGYWLSGEKGIVHFDGRNCTPLIDSLMPTGYTYTLVKDNRGGIWVTSDEGLFFKGKSSAGLRYGLPEELNTSVNSIILMDTSHILVGRMADICIINTTRFYNNDPDYFKIYDSSYGFTGNNCLDNGIIKDKQGHLWILSSGRVNILDPKKLTPNIYPPKVNVTDIEYETDSMTWESLHIDGLFYNKQGEVRINHKNNNLRFRFTGISTTNPGQVMYQYRLTGHEDVWSHKNYAREAIFQGLSPGDYEFQLKAFNCDGRETPEIYSVKFSVTPGIWQTLVFKTIAIISLLALIVLITWRIAKVFVKKKNEDEELKSEMKWLQMNSIIRQFDPHFTFNVISSVGSLIMKGKKETAYNYIVKLSGLLRTVLADGSVMIRPLSEEIDFVRKYCELQELRFKERLTTSFIIGENVDLQRHIPKMTIQTFVENSIKHGIENRFEGGQVTVRIEENDHSLEILVTDNGVGRKSAESITSNRSGYGLKTINAIFDFMNRINRVKARIEIMDLADNHNKAAGTEVKVTIPDDYIFELKTITRP